MKIDKTVKRETLYIAAWTVVLSLLMEAVFLVIRAWDYTVLLGNLLGGGVAVLNFLLMGLTIQKAVTEDEKQASKRMRASQSYRLMMQAAVLILAGVLGCFDILAAAIPLLFPRIGIMVRPLFNKAEQE